MPHFSGCCAGADVWICQSCAKRYCGGCKSSAWMTVPGREYQGNICMSCCAKYKIQVNMARCKTCNWTRTDVFVEARDAAANHAKMMKHVVRLGTSFVPSAENYQGDPTAEYSRPREEDRPMGVYEWASKESGYPMGSIALERYVNRWYGHG